MGRGGGSPRLWPHHSRRAGHASFGAAPADRRGRGLSPWNFPTSSPARKVGGALSAGCSIILKASEETPVGKHLTALAGAHMKPVIMELGAHSPVIVCDDVDPATSDANSAVAKSRNAGQVCVSPTRFFVEDAIYDRFTQAITE